MLIYAESLPYAQIRGTDNCRQEQDLHVRINFETKETKVVFANIGDEVPTVSKSHVVPVNHRKFYLGFCKRTSKV